MTPYGTMVAVRDCGGVRFVIAAYSTPNARTEPTIAMFRALLKDAGDDAAGARHACGRQVLVIQYDDMNHHDVGSVAYCRRRGEAPAVRLVPDTFFFLSGGYRSLREAAAARALPPWEARQDLVFWRGSPTHNGIAIDGSRIERIEQIPRVVLCRQLQGQTTADAAIMSAWGFDFQPDQVARHLAREGMFRPPVAMIRQAEYRYLIDIDGVANAWAFFERLLLGACILKVGSPFEQWYYHELEEWRHFVPVRADLSDMEAQIDWVRAQPRRAREIAEEGQRFALQHTFAAARRVAVAAIRRSLVAMDG